MRKLLWNVIALLSVSASASRFVPQPVDYRPSGALAPLVEDPFDSDCFESPEKLLRPAAQRCLVSLRDLGKRTFGLSNKYRLERDLKKLFIDFGKTASPSDWDLHAPFLSLIIQRLHPTGHLERDVLNPGLWITASHQALAIVENLGLRSKGAVPFSQNILSDLIHSGSNFLTELNLSHTPANWNQSRTSALFNSVTHHARETAGLVTARYQELARDRSSGFDFKKNIGDFTKLELGHSLDVTRMPACKGVDFNTNKDDEKFPDLYYSHHSEKERVPGFYTNFQNAIRRESDEVFLVAEDLLTPSKLNLTLCVLDRGWETEKEERKDGGGGTYSNYLTGRFFVTLRAEMDGQLIFIVRVSAGDPVRHHVRSVNNGSTAFIDYNSHEIDRNDLLENKVLKKYWVTEHLLVKNFIAGKDVRHIESGDEQKAMDITVRELRGRNLAALRAIRETFLSDTLAIISGSDAALAWEGASKALRTYMMLKAFETFQVDGDFRNAITLEGPIGGIRPIADRVSLQGALREENGDVLFSVGRGEDTHLVGTLAGALTTMNQKVSTEVAPQKLIPVFDTLQKLEEKRAGLRADSPKLSADDALEKLKITIHKSLEAGK